MTPLLRSITRIPKVRLNRRVVLWVFISVIVIEGIILVPSYHNRKNELLAQLKSVSKAKVSVLLRDHRDHHSLDSQEALVERLSLLVMPPAVTGLHIYTLDGEKIATFGEAPRLSHEMIQTRGIEDQLFTNPLRYDISCHRNIAIGHYLLVLSHDATGVRQELYAFILRIAGLVVIISAVVTIGTWLALDPIVLRPILDLRKDLISAGEAVQQDREPPPFRSAHHPRKDELGDVITAFRKMFAQIREAIDERKHAEDSLQESFQQVEAYSKALNNELEKGRKIQRDFLPTRFPTLAGWEICSCFYPARQVSGDFYDVFRLPNDLVGLVIGDVSDKGVGAALYMALIRSLIRVFSGHYRFASQSDIQMDCRIQDWIQEGTQGQADILRALELTNAYLIQEHDEDGMFASIFFGVLDPGEGRLAYVNAGHEPLYILNGDSEARPLKATGPVIGLSAETRYKPITTTMAVGSTLIGYTDGVSEARSSRDELYTRRRLLDVIQQAPPTGAADLLKRVEDELFAFIDKAPQEDDTTILVVHRKGA